MIKYFIFYLGYQGNGYNCERILHCNPLNNPCHPNATCIELVSIQTFRCDCPNKMFGNGVGLDGCKASNETVCMENMCLNGGTCRVSFFLIIL